MEKQTAGRNSLGDLAPKFAELNDDILFGEVWSREDKLSLRDRCMITVTALISKGITDSSLKYHIQNAKNHGITKSEMAEIITHIAFYVGWPNAWAVFPMVREVYAEDSLGESDSLFGLGAPNDAFAKYFVGKSYLKPLNTDGVGVFNVTFEPRCRNNWHIHHKGGQLLLCTDGEGWYQEWLKPARKLMPGDVVYIAPEIKHWHGAGKDGYFTHIAVEIPAEGASNEWLEPVDDAAYNAL
ncbi:MAG: carboxymuconolactone decarboxylase family protein [Oscillospiraceae bacterium]|nr:carboxymuconolactone decarboxylase family protein [Oscillospiraceae bacterium]